MATPRVENRIIELSSLPIKKLDLSGVRFALRNWDDTDARLRRNVLAWIKAQDKVSPALQLELVEVSERALSVLPDLHPNAQALILKSFKDDVPSMLGKAVNYSKIGDALWKRIGLAIKKGELPAARAKRLANRDDAPEALQDLVTGERPAKVEKPARPSTKSRTGTRKTATAPVSKKKEKPEVTQLKTLLSAFVEDGTNRNAIKAAKYADSNYDALGLGPKTTSRLDDALDMNFNAVQSALFCKAAARFFKIEGATPAVKPVKGREKPVVEKRTRRQVVEKEESPRKKTGVARSGKSAADKVKEVFKPAKKLSTGSKKAAKPEDGIDDFLKDSEKVRGVVRRVRRPAAHA